MNAPLPINASYRVYSPEMSSSSLAYEEYFWAAPKEEPEEKEEAEPVHSSEGLPGQESSSGSEERTPHHLPDLSPRPSSSGMFTHYIPDSATSPNNQPLSPQQASSPQKCLEGSKGKKCKNRTAFSQEQLQFLHLRFQTQKYLSPQQIREVSALLGLTYKQVKTWFQNQRMKNKRNQKETLWRKRGMCQPPNGFPDIQPIYHQGFSVGDAKHIHPLASVHESYANNQHFGSNQSYGGDQSQLYGGSQSFYPVASGEDGTFFGKPAGSTFGPQAIGYISQQKMNFYHGFSASMEYATMKMGDGCPFQNMAATTAAFPGTPAFQHYQPSLQSQGAQSDS